MQPLLIYAAETQMPTGVIWRSGFQVVRLPECVDREVHWPESYNIHELILQDKLGKTSKDVNESKF